MRTKLTTILGLLCVILFLSIPATHAAGVVYSYVDTQTLSRGATLSSYKLFMSDRTWNSAQVVRVDLNEPHLALEILSDPRGINYLNNVQSIAKSHDTIAAVNSDFFSWDQRAGRGSPIGAVYSGGSFLSSPANGNQMYTLAQSWDKSVFVDMFQYSMTLVAPNGNRQVIKGLNKSDDLTSIMMYNKYWDSVSLGSTATLHEMVVNGGVVQKIRFNSEPITFDDNTFILSTLSDWNTFLIDNFQPGDKVEIEVSSNIDTSNLILAAGGGAKILENGQIPASFSHNPTGNNPRTAAGVDASGKILYLVTVDGRLANSRGMTLTELAQFMQNLGISNAINFDGGGSTTMVAKNPLSGAQEVVNTPSEGSLRSISTVLGVKSDQPEDNNPAVMEITPDDEEVWVNSRVKLTANALNQYLTPVWCDVSQVEWSVDGVSGTVTGNEFRPTSAGMATLTAHYGGATGSVQIRVLDRPYSIEHSDREVYLGVGEAKDIWFFARDEKGYLGHIPISDMSVTASSDVISISGTAITGKASGSALVSVTLGDATSYFAVHVGGDTTPIDIPDDKTGTDSANKTGTPPDDSNKAMRFGVFGNIREANTLFNNLIMQKMITAMNTQADRAVFLSLYTSERINSRLNIPVTTYKPYASFIENGNTFISLDTEDNFMSGTEWNWLVGQFNNLQTKNVFVFMPTHMQFTSQAESQMLKDLFAGAVDYGYEVYVFYNNWATTSTPYDGVRYISTPGFSDDITPENFASINFKLRYILVDIDTAGNVTYRYMQLY